jgi:hypothetical protein
MSKKVNVKLLFSVYDRKPFAIYLEIEAVQ